MNWLTNAVLPKIQALVRREVPDNLWRKCPACGQMLFHRDLEENLLVCPQCDHHMRLPASDRIAMLFDDGTSEIVDLPGTRTDPLRFRDRRRYTDRLREAQAKSGRPDAIIVAHGRIGAHPAVCAVFDFQFMGGSMGTGVGEGLVRAARLAEARNAPLIVFPASGGARMQEGILSLMQMPRTVAAIDRLKDKGLAFIVVLTDPTTGGVTASFAMLGDLHLAEPGAIIGFAGQRVIRETIREQLPDGFQKAEYLRDHGMVDLVVHRHDMKATIGRVLGLLTRRQPGAASVSLPQPELDIPEHDPNASATQAAERTAGGDAPAR